MANTCDKRNLGKLVGDIHWDTRTDLCKVNLKDNQIGATKYPAPGFVS